MPRWTTWCSEYADAYEIAPELPSGGDRHESLRYGARIEAGLRAFLTEGGFGAFTTNFEDLGGLRQLPGLAVQRLMADGLRLRRRGRLEDLGHAAHDQGDRRRRSPAAPPSWRTTPTTSGPGRRRSSASHMLEVCPTIAAGPAADRDPPARHRRPRGPGPAGLRRGAGPGDRPRASAISVTGSGWCSTRSTSSRPDEPLPKLPVARAVWEPKPDLATSAESWITAGGPHHTVLSTAVDTEQLVDFANLLGVELLIIDGSTNRRDFADRLRWNQAYYRLAQGSRRWHDMPDASPRPHRARDRAGLDPDQGGADRTRTTRRSPSAATTGRTSSSTGSGPTPSTRSGPGSRQCYAALGRDVRRRHGVELTSVGALGISAMMHGYLAFDADGELLTPFRTWRNTEHRRGRRAAERRVRAQHPPSVERRAPVPGHPERRGSRRSDRAPDHAGRLRPLAAHGRAGDRHR